MTSVIKRPNHPDVFREAESYDVDEGCSFSQISASRGVFIIPFCSQQVLFIYFNPPVHIFFTVTVMSKRKLYCCNVAQSSK